MKHSILTKITVLIVSVMLIFAVSLGAASMISMKNALRDDAATILNTSCQHQADKLNTTLLRIEQSVQILAEYSGTEKSNRDKMNDPDYLADFAKRLSNHGSEISGVTPGVVAHYVRFNPELFGPQAGYFSAINHETGKIENREPTSFDQFDPNDMEMYGWYFLPVNAGKAMWTDPYFHKNIGLKAISYVIPVYYDEELICVVGADIDFNSVTADVDSAKIYETGSLALTDNDFTVVHSKLLDQGTEIYSLLDKSSSDDIDDTEDVSIYEFEQDGEVMTLSASPTINGMHLLAIVPEAEIMVDMRNLAIRFVLISCIMFAVAVAVAVAVARSFVRPLRELNDAARSIADGQLDINLKKRTRDEIGDLTESIGETAKQLKTRIEYINNLAYIDRLTGIPNNTAYLDAVYNMDSKISEGNADFTVFVMDLNDLKIVNDRYGHEYGNEMLIATANALTKVFGYEKIFRVGGDEFVAIVEGATEEDAQTLNYRLVQEISEQQGNFKLTVAYGYERFDASKHDGFKNVFRCADEKMYKRKANMKTEGKTSTVYL